MDKNKAFLNEIAVRCKLFLNLKLFKVEIKFYLIFLAVILVGFWPVSTGIFALKNDEIVYFLPYRYNIVENLRNGHLPLWSPYIYMGFPVSGDMQSGAWNPLVWLLALTGRYTLTTLHAELLIYIFFAVLGMFKLLRTLRFNSMVCFTIAVSYAFSGFIIDSGQFICWESCACFLPYTYIYFIRLLERPSRTIAVKFAVANFCLLIVAGYPFFFIANIYFLAFAFLIYCLISWRKNKQKTLPDVFKYLSLSVLLCTLLSAAPLLCFVNLLPFYSRGTNMPLSAALFNSYAPFSSISFFFPFAVTRDHPAFGNNNVLSRNLYVGIIMLPFIVKGMLSKKGFAWNILLAFIIISSAISLGDTLPFRKWAYWFLPLMNTFRHPSNFRLFITVGLMVFAAKGLQELLITPKESRVLLSRLFYFILLVTLVFGIYFLPLHETNPFIDLSLTPSGLKKILNTLSFKQSLFLTLLVQVPFLIAAIVLFKKGKYTLLCMLTLTNSIILAQPQLLSSTVAKNSVSEINRFIKNQPGKFPIPLENEPIAFPDEKKIFIYEYKQPIKYFFNKKIAINTYINNPTILKTYASFVNDSSLINSIKNCPFLFLADTLNRAQRPVPLDSITPLWLPVSKSELIANGRNRVSLKSFQPGEFTLMVTMGDPGALVVLQNNFPGWVARTGKRLIPIETVNDTFMGLQVPAGSYEINLQYKPVWLIPGMVISITGLLLVLFILMCDLKFINSHARSNVN